MRGKKTAVLFFVLFLGVLSGYLSALDSPDIKFDSKKINFGKVKGGEILTHNFMFENAGNSLLIIKDIKTSCGCTAVLASKKNLEPGEKGSLKVTFNTRGYSGNVSKYIYVYSNDPKESRSVLSVSANVEVPPGPKIRLEKTSMDIGLILQGEDISCEAVVRNTGELELEVTFSHKAARFFTQGKELKKSLKIPSNGQRKVVIEISSSDKTGSLREYVLLKTNDPLRPNLSFYIRGYIITERQLKELFEKYKHVIRNKSKVEV